MGIIGNDEAIKPLNDSINDDDFDVRYTAAVSLKRIGSNKAIDILIQNLNNKNWVDKNNTIVLLRQIGSLEILEKLIKLPEIGIYNSHVLSLARDLAIRHSKKKTPFIPVTPELIRKYKGPSNEL